MSSEQEPSPEQRLIFERSRGRLWGVAYRMLGSRAEAEDMLQEAYLRWHRAAIEEIRAPEAWLVTTVTRLCVDRLRQLRVERRAYVGPWLPEPLVGTSTPSADHAAELASDLSVAFLALLERLAPEERAAFLLHEVFESEYQDIAAIIGKNEAACRKLVSRARQRVRAAQPRVQVSEESRALLLSAFVRALNAKDQSSLEALFAEDAAWTADGGGKAFAARKVIFGPQRIARFALGILKRSGGSFELREVLVNQEPGLALSMNGRLTSILTFRTDGARILDVFSIVNPDKLRGVTLS